MANPESAIPSWIKLDEVVEEVTAADKRQHNVVHVLEWISTKELCSKTTGKEGQIT